MHLSLFGTRLLQIAFVTLSLEAVMLLNSTASAADNELTDPASVARAFPPKSPEAPMANFPAKKAPYKIAFSNSYFGNNWRAEMLKADSRSRKFARSSFPARMPSSLMQLRRPDSTRSWRKR